MRSVLRNTSQDRPNRELVCVSQLTFWVSRKPPRKYVGRGSGVIRLLLAGEVNPRVRLLVEAEDLQGG